MLEQQKPWNPLTVSEVMTLFASAPFPWWIAGGIALELAIGYPLRKHADIDVLILRRNCAAAFRFLSSWNCWVADPPGQLRPWDQKQHLKPGVHDVWCRMSPDDDWRLQLMIDEALGNRWVSRRNNQIQAPLENITRQTKNGVRYLAPEIQLFYKAKHPRAKDELDFEAVMDSGIPFDKAWLRQAISRAYGEQHIWLSRLANNDP